MWAQFVVVAILATRVVWGKEKCVCSNLYHPQSLLCKMDFAYRVKMVNAEDTFQPGETNTDENQLHSYMKYTAEVLEVFKGEEHLWAEDNDTSILTEIYTPANQFCGRQLLYHPEKSRRQHLVVGTVEKSRYNTSYKAITSCTWAQQWSNLTQEQKTGLRSEYHQCVCKAYPASAEKRNKMSPQRRFSTKECFYNPVSATKLKVDDCEQLYGYCDREAYGRGCHWRHTPAYMDCYHARRDKLGSSAQPALSTKQDCKLYTGRKKKMCIIKFVKSRIRQKQSRREQ